MGGLPTNQTANGFAVDPKNPQVMYVAMRGGTFKSADAGESWKRLGKEIKKVAALAVNPKNPAEVYASTTDGIIFKSRDGGMTWRKQN